MPIHHVGLVVPDLEEGKAFYLAALAPLGYKEFHSYPGFAIGLGVSASASDFWLSAGKSQDGGPNKPPSKGLHFAFKAESREVVDQFHEAALYVYHFMFFQCQRVLLTKVLYIVLQKSGGEG